MYAQSVEKASARKLASYHIRDFTLARLPLCVLNVENPVHTNQVLLTIREFTQERNPIHAVTVGKPLEISRASIDIGELIQERDPMGALIVGKPSPTCHALCIIRECCMQERNV